MVGRATAAEVTAVEAWWRAVSSGGGAETALNVRQVRTTSGRLSAAPFAVPSCAFARSRGPTRDDSADRQTNLHCRRHRVFLVHSLVEHEMRDQRPTHPVSTPAVHENLFLAFVSQDLENALERRVVQAPRTDRHVHVLHPELRHPAPVRRWDAAPLAPASPELSRHPRLSWPPVAMSRVGRQSPAR